MQLIPINERLEENKEFLTNPLCLEILEMTVDFYKIAGRWVRLAMGIQA